MCNNVWAFVFFLVSMPEKYPDLPGNLSGEVLSQEEWLVWSLWTVRRAGLWKGMNKRFC